MGVDYGQSQWLHFTCDELARGFATPGKLKEGKMRIEELKG